jgi:hypothetical protein
MWLLIVIILFHGNSSIRAVQFTSQANCQAAADAITDHIADMVGYKPPAGKESNPFDKLELSAKLGIDVHCTPLDDIEELVVVSSMRPAIMSISKDQPYASGCIKARLFLRAIPKAKI